MKTAYVLILLMFATITLIAGVVMLVFAGEPLWMVQSVFNCMIAAGALARYRTGE